jgi:hypothetical protein
MSTQERLGPNDREHLQDRWKPAIQPNKEPSVMVRQPDATMHPPQDNQLMSKHRVLGFKPQLRLEWRGQDGQDETDRPDHSASLGDSVASSTRIGFLVHATGDIAQGRAHYDQALMLFDPAEHHALATRFGQDVGVSILSYRSLALWMVGYPEASRADAELALKEARAISHFPTLIYALYHVSWVLNLHRDYETVSALLDELRALSEEKGALFWKISEAGGRGCLLALIGKASDAVPMLTSVLAETGSTTDCPPSDDAVISGEGLRANRPTQ